MILTHVVQSYSYQHKKKANTIKTIIEAGHRRKKEKDHRLFTTFYVKRYTFIEVLFYVRKCFAGFINFFSINVTFIYIKSN